MKLFKSVNLHLESIGPTSVVGCLLAIMVFAPGNAESQQDPDGKWNGDPKFLNSKTKAKQATPNLTGQDPDGRLNGDPKFLSAKTRAKQAAPNLTGQQPDGELNGNPKLLNAKTRAKQAAPNLTGQEADGKLNGNPKLLNAKTRAKQETAKLGGQDPDGKWNGNPKLGAKQEPPRMRETKSPTQQSQQQMNPQMQQGIIGGAKSR